MRLISSLAAAALLALPVTAMAKPAAKSAPATQVHKNGKHVAKAKASAPSKSMTATPTPAPSAK